MILTDPRLDDGAEGFGKLSHLFRLRLRDGVRPLVVGDVALLAKDVEFRNHGRLDAERELKRVNNAVMMVVARGIVPGGSQRSGGKLESRVVCNVELPIGNQIRRLAGLQVPIGDGEEVGDFLPACLVLLEPSELEPVFEAHPHRRSEKPLGQTPHR